MFSKKNNIQKEDSNPNTSSFIKQTVQQKQKMGEANDQLMNNAGADVLQKKDAVEEEPIQKMQEEEAVQKQEEEEAVQAKSNEKSL